MSLRIGDTVDDVSLLRADGTSVPLSAFTNQALVLIFLRHLT
jgi:peroxiredoxin